VTVGHNGIALVDGALVLVLDLAGCFLSSFPSEASMRDAPTPRPLAIDPFSTWKGSIFVLALIRPSKALVLARLGWNSYGTEGAQPVAKVPLTRGPKTA